MNIYKQLEFKLQLALVSHILFIGISFYALQAFRLDLLFKKGKTFQIQLMYILLSIAIGYSCIKFCP